ncbi:MAG: D-aminoacyl-tRNA deacylase [bacterium]
MRALIQRVSRASVILPGGNRRSTGRGLLILLGVAAGDTAEDAFRLADKTAELRIFSNPEGKFDFSLLDVKGEALVISQFTLYADCAKGRRPDFSAAAEPALARKLYEDFAARLRDRGTPVKTGEFGAHMEVEIHNDGPVTIMLESGTRQHEQF